MTKKEKCSYAGKYKAKKKPTCGCKTCEDKWNKKQKPEVNTSRMELVSSEIKALKLQQGNDLVIVTAMIESMPGVQFTI